jgi:hypothetical protein
MGNEQRVVSVCPKRGAPLLSPYVFSVLLRPRLHQAICERPMSSIDGGGAAVEDNDVRRFAITINSKYMLSYSSNFSECRSPSATYLTFVEFLDGYF